MKTVSRKTGLRRLAKLAEHLEHDYAQAEQAHIIATARPLLKCGHTAQGDLRDGSPVCPICIGLHPGATQPVETLPDLTDRQALCICGRREPSRIGLPFFEHTPKLDHDNWYCGCRGWA